MHRRYVLFFVDPDRRERLRTVESEIALECLGSFAFLTGWELSRNAGVRACAHSKTEPRSLAAI